MSASPKSNRRPGEVETTGHEWDGIEEFNNPLPRWWLWIFYATIVWGIGYTIAYPAWPMLTRATAGVLGHSTRADVAAEIDRFAAANAAIRTRLVETDLTQVAAEPELLTYAQNAGAAVFRTWCAQCHGSGAAGVQAAGYPNLLDDDWLWGGDIEAIHTTITHGIRNTTDPDARLSEMPAYGELLEKAEIEALVAFVRQMSGQDHDATTAAAGVTLYADNCSGCHGEAGEGNRDAGAPPLDEGVWLYGGGAGAGPALFHLSPPRGPANFYPRLTEADIRSVALYVHGLGGGEETPAE